MRINMNKIARMAFGAAFIVSGAQLMLQGVSMTLKELK